MMFLVILAALVILSYLVMLLLQQPKRFFLVFFALKPFVDQTVNVRFLNVAGEEINLLMLLGALMFLAAFGLAFQYGDFLRRPLRAQGLIVLFLLLHFFSSTLAVMSGQRSLVGVAEIFMRFSTPFFLYFIFHRYMADRGYRVLFVRTIWLSNSGACLLTVAFYLLNMGNHDISQGVIRFSGYYGDTGTLAIVAFTAFFFGLLNREIGPRFSKGSLWWILFQATMLVSLFVIWISLTKAALIAMAVALLMWYGLRKRQYVVIIFLSMAFVFAFFESSNVRQRFRKEISVVDQYIQGEALEISTLRGTGSGRFGRWVDILQIYRQEYSIFEQLFGANQFFKAHNQYLATLMQIGMLGLTVFLLMVASMLRALWRRYYRTRDGTVFMGLVFFTAALVFGIGYISFSFTNLMWVTMALVSHINTRVNSRVAPKLVVGKPNATIQSPIPG